MSDSPLQPIRGRESSITRNPAKNELGPKNSGDKLACVEVLRDCKQRDKLKYAWGLYKSDLLYPERQAGGVRFIPFSRLRRNRKNVLDGITRVVDRRNS